MIECKDPVELWHLQNQKAGSEYEMRRRKVPTNIKQSSITGTIRTVFLALFGSLFFFGQYDIDLVYEYERRATISHGYTIATKVTLISATLQRSGSGLAQVHLHQ